MIKLKVFKILYKKCEHLVEIFTHRLKDLKRSHKLLQRFSSEEMEDKEIHFTKPNFLASISYIKSRHILTTKTSASSSSTCEIKIRKTKWIACMMKHQTRLASNLNNA